MTFDFKSYLERLDPAYTYQVDQLTGGVINFTVRASKAALADSAAAAAASETPTAGSDSNLSIGAFPGHKSLILKHATSHIAEVGEGSHIPQTRQLVEATALALFLGEQQNLTADSSLLPPTQSRSLHSILEQTRVMIPEILHYDASNHVLILSDLGPLPDLSRVFCELGGYTPGPGDTHRAPLLVPHSPTLGEQLVEHEVAFFEMLGRKLGSFFAQLHSQRVRQAVLSTSFNLDQGVAVQGGSNDFPSLPEMKTVVHEHVIKPLRSQLLLFPSLLDVNEAEVLFSAIEADFLRETAEQERCFVIGDCWTGTILLNLESRAEDINVGIIDWEFANISGRGVNGDMSQFLAHLELFLIAAHSQGEGVAPGHISALRAILKGLVSTYKDEREKTEDIELKDTIIRSAFLSHGAELINCAFWKIWICRESGCLSCHQKGARLLNAQPDDKPSESLNVAEAPSDLQCKLISKMVSSGISFLRCAVAEDPMKASSTLLRTETAYGMQSGLIDFFTLS